VANILKSEGIKKGDSVGLFMTNRPEYLCFWLGVSRVRELQKNHNRKLHSYVCALKTKTFQPYYLHTVTAWSKNSAYQLQLTIGFAESFNKMCEL